MPKTQEYEIPVDPDWKVLDALNFIKDEIDGTLSHRWSCRMAVCGSCGMMVDGEPKLTCKEALSDYGDTVEVAPLANFPIVRDLVVELDGFMDKFKSVKPWIIRAKERAVEEGPMRQSPEELEEFKQFSMCINCMLCYSACPVVANEPEFIGPAAIALGHRYNLDSRDEGAASETRSSAARARSSPAPSPTSAARSARSTSIPAAAVNQAKFNAVIDWAKGLILPRGGEPE